MAIFSMKQIKQKLDLKEYVNTERLLQHFWRKNHKEKEAQGYLQMGFRI